MHPLSDRSVELITQFRLPHLPYAPISCVDPTVGNWSIAY